MYLKEVLNSGLKQILKDAGHPDISRDIFTMVESESNYLAGIIGEAGFDEEIGAVSTPVDLAGNLYAQPES